MGFTDLMVQQEDRLFCLLQIVGMAFIFGLVGLSDELVDSKSLLGLVIGYRVDSFTHTWVSRLFCCSFTSALWVRYIVSHFPLQPGGKDYTFLNQAIEGSEHGLDSIFKDSIKIPELVVPVERLDAVAF